MFRNREQRGAADDLSRLRVVAAGGQSFVTIWSEAPVSGFDYWLRICAPPEFLVKVAILASLTVVCALVPLVEHVALRLRGRSAQQEGPRRASP